MNVVRDSTKYALDYINYQQKKWSVFVLFVQPVLKFDIMNSLNNNTHLNLIQQKKYSPLDKYNNAVGVQVMQLLLKSL